MNTCKSHYLISYVSRTYKTQQQKDKRFEQNKNETSKTPSWELENGEVDIRTN